MSLLTGAAAIGSAAQSLSAIASALFPNEIKISIGDDEVNIDSAQDISTGTSVEISEHPSEDGKVYVQNISKNPRTLTLSCVLSNIIRLSTIKTLASAVEFSAALLIPEVAQISNILLNEEDSITIRLRLLRKAQDNGTIVQVLGLPDQDQFNYLITNVDDSETVQTGDKSRSVQISIREVFIVGFTGREFTGLTSLIDSEIPGTPGDIPTPLAEIS